MLRKQLRRLGVNHSLLRYRKLRLRLFPINAEETTTAKAEDKAKDCHNDRLVADSQRAKFAITEDVLAD